MNNKELKVKFNDYYRLAVEIALKLSYEEFVFEDIMKITEILVRIDSLHLSNTLKDNRSVNK